MDSMLTERDTAAADQLYKLNDQKPGAELKGSAFTLTVLRLLSSDLTDVERDLRQKIAIGPRFFANAPVVLDLERVRTNELDFVALLKLLRELDLVPVGARHATPAQQDAAIAAGLAIVKGGGIRDLPVAAEAKEATNDSAEASSDRAKAQEPAREPPAVPVQEELPPARAREPSSSLVGGERTKTITRPVRSGQQVYAKGGDLIVLAAVNAGAEVVADGNIHIYGPLRGRALAGAQGDREARIFCLDMEAELVAIAGCYQMVDESVSKDIRGRTVQAYLDGDKMCFDKLA